MEKVILCHLSIVYRPLFVVFCPITNSAFPIKNPASTGQHDFYKANWIKPLVEKPITVLARKSAGKLQKLKFAGGLLHHATSSTS